MGKRIPISTIPDSEVLPLGLVEVTCKSLKSGNTDDGVRFYTLAGRVSGPDDVEGFPFFDKFYVGTEDDAEADDDKTWKTNRHAIRFKKLLLKAGLPDEDIEDDDVLNAAIKDVKVIASVSLYADTGKFNPENKGKPRNSVRTYFALGEREPEVDFDSFERLKKS